MGLIRRRQTDVELVRMARWCVLCLRAVRMGPGISVGQVHKDLRAAARLSHDEILPPSPGTHSGTWPCPPTSTLVPNEQRASKASFFDPLDVLDEHSTAEVVEEAFLVAALHAWPILVFWCMLVHRAGLWLEAGERRGEGGAVRGREGKPDRKQQKPVGVGCFFVSRRRGGTNCTQVLLCYSSSSRQGVHQCPRPGQGAPHRG